MAEHTTNSRFDLIAVEESQRRQTDRILREHREQQEHLKAHLYDGRWHDNCLYCQRRRVNGGTGL